MSVEPTTVPSTPHADQSWPREWTAVEHAGETLIVHDVPERLVDCYRVAGHSVILRAMLQADAVLYEGSLVKAVWHEEHRTVQLYHEYAGIRDRFRPDELLDEPVVVLDECERTEVPTDT